MAMGGDKINVNFKDIVSGKCGCIRANPNASYREVKAMISEACMMKVERLIFKDDSLKDAMQKKTIKEMNILEHHMVLVSFKGIGGMAPKRPRGEEGNSDEKKNNVKNHDRMLLVKAKAIAFMEVPRMHGMSLLLQEETQQIMDSANYITKKIMTGNKHMIKELQAKFDSGSRNGGTFGRSLAELLSPDLHMFSQAKMAVEDATEYK